MLLGALCLRVCMVVATPLQIFLGANCSDRVSDFTQKTVLNFISIAAHAYFVLFGYTILNPMICAIFMMTPAP